MPLPLLIGAAAVSGVYGLCKAGGAVSDNITANEINGVARDIVECAERDVNRNRALSNSSLEELGRKKIDAITQTLKRFIQSYSQLKNVDLLVKGDMDKLGLHDLDEAAIKEISNDISILESSVKGLGAGSVGGALVAFGAYNGTMMLGAASTGTAISSLSGAAATNATLAWLGGGALSAGGMGMAGGVMVLGGIVAGPALAIFGHVIGSSASEKLSDARSNREQAELFNAECNAISAKLKGISHVAKYATETLSSARTASRRASQAMADVIQRAGVDYKAFSEADQAVVFKAVKLAQLVKVLVDTPILDINGNLLGNSEATFQKYRRAVESTV